MVKPPLRNLTLLKSSQTTHLILIKLTQLKQSMGSIQSKSKSKSTQSSSSPPTQLQMNSTASKPVKQQSVLSTSTSKTQPFFDIVDLIDAELPVSQAVSSIFHSTPTALHIPVLVRSTSEEILEVWNQPRTLIHSIEEYHEAQSAIILEPKWLKHTKLQKYIRYIDQEFKKNPKLKATMHSQSEFSIMLHKLIAKAYPEKKDNPRSAHDIVHGCNIFESVMKLCPNLRWRQPYLTYALYLLHQHAEPDTIVSKLSETCDRANRCSSAQRQAFNILICAAYNSNTMKSTSILAYDDLSTKEGALMRVYECIEDFLDDHKERAFMSAFMAPARFYYHITNNDFGKDHVNIHGLNWYLALLHSTLGIQLPYLPEMGDDGLIGVVDFWNGLTDDAWSKFSDPMNFGLDFEGIQTFKNKSSHNLRSFLKKTVNDNEFPLGHRTSRPKILGNDAVNTNQQSSEIRRKLSLYLNRFVYFFNQDFLVKKLFETLNSEMKPEHIGFRKAFQTLYEVYRSVCLSDVDADSYVDHCYIDEFYTTLNVNRTGRFLSWLRVTKANIFLDELNALVSVDDSTKSVDDTCPICFEVKSDITQLEHTGSTSYGGDLSGHRMCQDCRFSYGKDECPFCKEAIEGKESDGFINTFIDLYTTVNKNDPNALAAIFEEWQLFELEFSSSVNVTNHVSVAIINHHSFKSYLCDCIATQTPALRDAAGNASFY